MRLRVALALFFVCVFGLVQVLGQSNRSMNQPQKHSPTIAQCRADADAWNKEEDTGPKNKDVGYQLSFGELLKREREMEDCMMRDAQHGSDGTVVGVRTSYKTIYHIYGTAMMVRYSHFLDRHQLMEKFIEEDEKGLR